MSKTVAVALPTSSDQGKWSQDERALVEAAGLVHVDAQSGQKTLAERPVVAAFLQHCARTGLDPIARQIYAIARKSKGQLKWQIQVSIDGARLIAERSGEYEGQTTPEFTGDGSSWTQVWLKKEYPAAARVGVYRRGFREPLYAVALWDAYVQTKDEWKDGRKTGKTTVSDMWSKMGPLMLAKCAEMLALRKAFPQDLSGLYSAEEMDQSRAAESVAELPQVPDEPAPDPRVAAWLAVKGQLDAVTTRDEFKALVGSFPESLPGRVIPGDAGGRTVHDYMGYVWSNLPDADVQTGEVKEPEPKPELKPDPAFVTDWPTTQIPDETVEAVIDDEEIPF